MLNIGVVTDINWDNFILINNKFKKINDEQFIVHVLYGKSLDIINNCSTKNNVRLMRNWSDNLCKTVYNMLKNCDIWIIFTNYIEYNTSSKLIIDKCNEYGIRYIIVSELHRENNFYSFDYDSNLTSFKKIIYNIEKIKQEDNIEEFNYDEYNNNFISKQQINIVLLPEIKEKLKTSYTSIYNKRQDKSIKLLYDKDELRKEKKIRQTNRKLVQLEFSKNRLSYYKNNK